MTRPGSPGGEHADTLRGTDRICRQLIETMNEGAAIVSADGGILYCNVRVAEMLARPLDRVLGTSLRNYLPPADQQALDAILTQARTEPSRREINLKTSEGRLVPVHLSASRLPDEGAEVVFCLVLTDLTGQMRHEQVVADERLARLILEQTTGAVIVCDEQGRVIRASQTAQRFCDASPLLRPFAEPFPLRTDAADPFRLAPVLQGETLRNVDVALDRQGQTFTFLLNAGPLVAGEQILGCVVTLTDFTERKKVEANLAESERTSRLKADIATVWTLNDTLPAVLNRCAEAMVQHLDAAFARIWTLNREENVLELQASAGMYTHLNGAHGRVPVGKFKIGLIAEERKPHLTNCVIGDPRVGDQEWAKKEGMVSFAGYPLIEEGRLVGVMAMFARRPLSELTLDALASVGERIAIGVERKQADVTRARLAAIVDSTDDAIFSTALDDTILTWNAGAERLFGYTANDMIGGRRALILPPGDSVEHVAAVLAKTARGEAGEPFETQRVRKDGSMIDVSITISPMTDATGRVTGTSTIARDIRNRKKAEAELKRLNDEIQRQRLRIFKATMRTVQDIVNNLLNGFQLFRIEGEGRLPAELLALVDQTIEEAGVKLKTLGDLETVNEREMVIGMGIEYPGAGS